MIDVGMHKRADGRLCGDVHFESVSRVASHITPVPGGVGPMTIAMLLKNTLQAARMSVAAGSKLRRIKRMFKIGICNELFEGMEFSRVCRLVKELGYDGLEIAPFTLAGLITELIRERRREFKSMVEDAGLETIGLHWLLAKTEGLYLTSPDAVGAPRDGRLPGRTRRGHPRPGRHTHGAGLAETAKPAAGCQLRASVRLRSRSVSIESCRAIGAAGVDLCFEPLAPNDTDFVNTCEQGTELVAQVGHPHFKLHMDVKAQSSEHGCFGSRADPQVRKGRRAFSRTRCQPARAGDGASRLQADHAGAC